jgi:hypothetical protein
MKKLRHKVSVPAIATIFLFLLTIACQKDDNSDFTLSRHFAPSTVTPTNGETQVIITWPPSLFTTLGEVEYAVEVYDPANTETPVFTTTTTNDTVVVTDESLAIKKDYYARVKAVANDKTADSNWITSTTFRITGEQFLLPVPTEDISDVGVILRWKVNPTLTRIVLTPTGGSPIEVTLDANDLAALQKTVMGLTQNKAYSAEIFQGAKTKGIVQFTTKASITGANLIDLTGTSGNPGILATTLTTAPSGSVIILRRGQAYTITTAYSFNKSLTIRSGLGFGTNLATIKMSTFFNLAANTAIDSIVFKDLTIRGGRAAGASYLNDYILNSNAVGATVNKIRLDNCVVKGLRGVVRAQAAGAGTIFTNYFVNNCVLDSIRDFAVAASTASTASKFVNIKITNTTIYKARKVIIHASAGNSSLWLENCTFNEIPGGTALASGNATIDFASVVGGNVTIKNCIFGSVWDELGAGTAATEFRSATGTLINITNSYSTSDHASTGPLPLSTYSGSSTSLFTDPVNGVFKIKDINFAGKSTAGDPRWR